MNEQKVPQIRFAGFTDAWEQRKLGEVFTIRNEKNGDRYTRDDVLAVSDTYGCINQIAFHGRSFAGEDISNYKVVRTGDIVYTKSPLQAKPHGIIKIVGEETGIISPLYVVNETIEGINSMFMYYLFDTPERTNNYLSPLVRKGAKNTMNISNEEWLSGVVTISTSIHEQQRIGTYFRNLDNLITLHQRKFDTLRKLKQSMLQKMFPKEGEKVPEIRFAGFTDDWEQRKLGEVLTLLKDGTHGTHKDSDNGPYLLSAKNIKNGQIIVDESSDRKITQEAYEQIHSTFKLQKEDVLLTIVGSIGESAILENAEGLTFQRSVAFLRTNDEMTSRFLRTEIEADIFQKELQDRKSQSAQPGVYLGELEKIPVIFPQIKEQEQIGEYFKNLDHLINLHQRKLETAKKLKKAMLQKMFI